MIQAKPNAAAVLTWAMNVASEAALAAGASRSGVVKAQAEDAELWEKWTVKCAGEGP